MYPIGLGETCRVRVRVGVGFMSEIESGALRHSGVVKYRPLLNHRSLETSLGRMTLPVDGIQFHSDPRRLTLSMRKVA